MRNLVVSTAVVVLLCAVAAGAQPISITPRTIQVDGLTCADLLVRQDDARDRLLIYLNGYVNGLRGQKVWDEKVEGERIDRAVKECRAAPTRPVLNVFTDLWPR